jgi:hypothetical protein
MLLNAQINDRQVKFKNGNGGHHRRRRRHQIRNGQRLAALRAFTAATLYRKNDGWTLAMAATSCGSNVPYVVAMLVLMASENMTLLRVVMAGKVSVLAAAREVGRLAKLVAAYRAANATDRVAFARAVGPADLFDTTLVPAL